MTFHSKVPHTINWSGNDPCGFSGYTPTTYTLLSGEDIVGAYFLQKATILPTNVNFRRAKIYEDIRARFTVWPSGYQQNVPGQLNEYHPYNNSNEVIDKNSFHGMWYWMIQGTPSSPIYPRLDFNYTLPYNIVYKNHEGENVNFIKGRNFNIV